MAKLSDEELKGWLTGSLAAVSYGDFSDEGFGCVLERWMQLVEEAKGAEEGERWGHRELETIYRVLLGHVPARKLRMQLVRFLHAGKWRPRWRPPGECE
jgi:hypothetical protein